MVMGYFNAKVGSERYEDIFGSHRLGTNNERGDRLIEWAQLNKMVAGKSWFMQHPRSLWTWQSPGNRVCNQTDYIMEREELEMHYYLSKLEQEQTLKPRLYSYIFICKKGEKFIFWVAISGDTLQGQMSFYHFTPVAIDPAKQNISEYFTLK